MLAKHNAEGVELSPMESSLNARVLREIRAEMARARLTQEQLALRLEPQRGQPWIQRRLAGKVALTLPDLEVIAAALGLPAYHLLRNQGAEV